MGGRIPQAPAASGTSISNRSWSFHISPIVNFEIRYRYIRYQARYLVLYLYNKYIKTLRIPYSLNLTINYYKKPQINLSHPICFLLVQVLPQLHRAGRFASTYYRCMSSEKNAFKQSYQWIWNNASIHILNFCQPDRLMHIRRVNSIQSRSCSRFTIDFHRDNFSIFSYAPSTRESFTSTGWLRYDALKAHFNRFGSHACSRVFACVRVCSHVFACVRVVPWCDPRMGGRIYSYICYYDRIFGHSGTSTYSTG